MDSFEGTARFCYNPSSEGMREEAFSGLLNVYIHHARNIHNICIYANQDVYAKFSLTCSPDEALSTRIVNGGGQNPQFDEHLKIKVTQPDSVLKCEIWMLSRVKNYMEDQLLGFTLVPVSLVAAAEGRLTQDFTLTSTDLFHSPAGTVRLTLSLDTSFSAISAIAVQSTLNSSISSEVVILNPAEYATIEFPDINAAKENQQMVSESFDMELHKPSRSPESNIPFLHLGASGQLMQDHDMNVNFDEDNNGSLGSFDGGIINSGQFSTSSTTSMSDDKTTAESVGKKIQVPGSSSIEFHQISGASPDTPTSKNKIVIEKGNESKVYSKEDSMSAAKEHDTVQLGSVFTSPLGNINLEAEQNGMQQQIVDMYVKSMQQFTESLANMKLPVNVDRPATKEGGDVIQTENKVESKKKDGSRVFYGSRAFF
ncbi:hypothetical protein Cni_G20765 [Canna indica]|uniref:C2 domain-containing protein n=1 Tax=Canna indica TaxID=4628 RepID=A0AAQ3QK27_9LILI|nr:hypothetical protein Cni_G20765 [Canna indica]